MRMHLADLEMRSQLACRVKQNQVDRSTGYGIAIMRRQAILLVRGRDIEIVYGESPT